MKSYNMILIEKLTGEDILLFTQQQVIEQTKCTYSPLGRAFDKQIKTIEDQGKNRLRLKPEDQQKPIKDTPSHQSSQGYISQELQLYVMILLTKEKK